MSAQVTRGVTPFGNGKWSQFEVAIGEGEYAYTAQVALLTSAATDGIGAYGSLVSVKGGYYPRPTINRDGETVVVPTVLASSVETLDSLPGGVGTLTLERIGRVKGGQWQNFPRGEDGKADRKRTATYGRLQANGFSVYAAGDGESMMPGNVGFSKTGSVVKVKGAATVKPDGHIVFYNPAAFTNISRVNAAKKAASQAKAA